VNLTGGINLFGIYSLDVNFTFDEQNANALVEYKLGTVGSVDFTLTFNHKNIRV
jgi:hypothetical protein